MSARKSDPFILDLTANIAFRNQFLACTCAFQTLILLPYYNILLLKSWLTARDRSRCQPKLSLGVCKTVARTESWYSLIDTSANSNVKHYLKKAFFGLYSTKGLTANKKLIGMPFSTLQWFKIICQILLFETHIWHSSKRWLSTRQGIDDRVTKVVTRGTETLTLL